LEALLKHNSQIKTYTIEEGNFHGGRIQQFVQTLFGKNETEIQVLFQKNGNAGYINYSVDAL